MHYTLEDSSARRCADAVWRPVNLVGPHSATAKGEVANRGSGASLALYFTKMSTRSSVVKHPKPTADSTTVSNANSRPEHPRIRSTTVLCVRRNASVVMAADGQVTLGDSVIKHTARKIRRLYQDKILAGFAGSTADAFSLFSRFEAKLEQYAGNLGRSAVELAKDWRTDKMLRNLEALLVVADLQQTFLISGSGDVIEPDEGIAAIGSGGSFALAAARALVENSDLPARAIAEKSLRIAGQICIYTNDQITIEELHG